VPVSASVSSVCACVCVYVCFCVTCQVSNVVSQNHACPMYAYHHSAGCQINSRFQSLYMVLASPGCVVYMSACMICRGACMVCMVYRGACMVCMVCMGGSSTAASLLEVHISSPYVARTCTAVFCAFICLIKSVFFRLRLSSTGQWKGRGAILTKSLQTAFRIYKFDCFLGRSWGAILTKSRQTTFCTYRFDCFLGRSWGAILTKSRQTAFRTYKLDCYLGRSWGAILTKSRQTTIRTYKFDCFLGRAWRAILTKSRQTTFLPQAWASSL